MSEVGAAESCTPVVSGILRPDPLQGLPEPLAAHRSAQCSLAEQGGELPELDPCRNSKDRPGHQHPERVVHHAAFCALRHTCSVNKFYSPFLDDPLRTAEGDTPNSF